MRREDFAGIELIFDRNIFFKKLLNTSKFKKKKENQFETTSNNFQQMRFAFLWMEASYVFDVTDQKENFNTAEKQKKSEHRRLGVFILENKGPKISPRF